MKSNTVIIPEVKHVKSCTKGKNKTMKHLDVRGESMEEDSRGQVGHSITVKKKALWLKFTSLPCADYL